MVEKGLSNVYFRLILHPDLDLLQDHLLCRHVHHAEREYLYQMSQSRPKIHLGQKSLLFSMVLG